MLKIGSFFSKNKLKKRRGKKNRGVSPQTGLALFACLQGCWLAMTVEIASTCSAITKRKTILLMPCKAVPKAKQDGSMITIPAHAAPSTSTRHGRLLGTAARRQETYCDAYTPTTSPPTTSAHPATRKDACWELQHKRPVWSEPKIRAVLEEHAANLC